MELAAHISALLGYPILGLVVYIAYAAGRMSQRVMGLERRMDRLETIVLEKYEFK